MDQITHVRKNRFNNGIYFVAYIISKSTENVLMFYIFGINSTILRDNHGKHYQFTNIKTCSGHRNQ